MKLVAEKKGKNDKADLLRCIRRDGTETAAPMPRQGILPHDLVHYTRWQQVPFHGTLELEMAHV